MHVENYIKMFTSSPICIVAIILLVLMIAWALLANLQKNQKDLAADGDNKEEKRPKVIRGRHAQQKYVKTLVKN